MKDPLQTEPSPYEILGVPRDATPEAVDRGFRNGLTQRQSVPRLTAAKRALQDPAERAVVDAFLYDPSFLGRMDPNPLTDGEALATGRRGATAQRWTRVLRDRFPETAALHSWSLLWFWSAVTAQPGSPAIAQRAWEHAIGGWSSLLASEDFRRWLGPSADAAASRIEERLRAALRDRQHGATEAGRADEAALFRNLEVELDAELRAARRAAGTGFPAGSGRLCCGRLLIDALDLGRDIRERLEAALRQDPSDAALAGLRAMLFSPLARVEALLAANDLGQALSVLDGLPEQERATPEARRLRARAWQAAAGRHADLDRVSDALGSWQAALDADDGELRAEIEGEIVAFCASRAAAWQATRRDEAIAVLEQGLALVPDQRLQPTLAEILTQRAMDHVNQALRAGDYERNGCTPALAGALRAPLQELEAAARLGSDRAREQAGVVRSLIARSQRGDRKSTSVDFNAMAPAARRRFVACTAGQARPAPLAVQRTGSSGLGWLVTAVPCALVLLALLVTGFGTPGGAYQGPVAFAFYFLSAFGLFAATLNIVNEQAARRGMPYRTGRYLFPLEVVEAVDGVLHLRPTSDLDRFEPVHHFNAGRYTHTMLTFDFKDKSRVVFRLSPRARADETLKALQDATEAEQQALQAGNLGQLRDLELFPQAS